MVNKQKSLPAGRGLSPNKISADLFYNSRHEKAEIELLASILDQVLIVSSTHPNRRCREKHAALARVILARIMSYWTLKKMGPGVAV